MKHCAYLVITCRNLRAGLLLFTWSLVLCNCLTVCLSVSVVCLSSCVSVYGSLNEVAVIDISLSCLTVFVCVLLCVSLSAYVSDDLCVSLSVYVCLSLSAGVWRQVDVVHVGVWCGNWSVVWRLPRSVLDGLDRWTQNHGQCLCVYLSVYSCRPTCLSDIDTTYSQAVGNFCCCSVDCVI